MMDISALKTRKKNLIYLRAIISLVIILIASYHYEKVLAGGHIIFYLASVVALNFIFIYMPERYYEGVKLQYIVFLLDLLIIALGAYFLTDPDFSVFLTIFLTVFISALSRSLSASIGIAIVMNALYLFVKLSMSETGFEGLIQNMSLLNMPLILLAAVHSSYLAEKAEEDIKEKKRLEKANAQLVDRAKRTDEEMDGLINFTARVYDSFREGIIITDNAGILKAFNTAAESIFTQRRSKVINMPYDELDSISVLREVFDGLKFKRKTADELKITKTEAGTVKVYTVNSSYIRDRSEASLGMLVTVRLQIQSIGRS